MDIISIPVFAWGILEAGGMAFSSFASSITSPVQSAAATAGYEASTGNYALGNVSAGNFQIKQTSGYKHDMIGGYSSSSFRSSDGIRDETSSIADESTVSHSDVSKVGGVEAQTTWNTSTQHTMQAMEADRASQTQSIASQEAFANSARDLVEYGRHRSEQKAHGHSESLSDTSSFAKHADQAYEIAHDYAEQHNISDSKAAELMIRAGVDSGSSTIGGIVKSATGFSAGISGKGSTKAEDSTQFQDAQRCADKSGFKESVSVAAQAAKSEQFTINNDEGRRYAQNVSSSFEKSQKFSQDAQASHAKSTEFLESAQKTQGISSTVTRNDIPWLLEEFAKEKLPNGTAIGGGAADLAQSQPDFFASFAQQKIAERNTQLEQYSTAHGLKPDHNIHSQISGFHEQNAHAINTSYKPGHSLNNEIQGIQQRSSSPSQPLRTQEQNSNSSQAIQQQAGNLTKPLQTKQFENKFNERNNAAQNHLEHNKVKQEGEKIKQVVEAEQDSSVSVRAGKTALKAGTAITSATADLVTNWKGKEEAYFAGSPFIETRKPTQTQQLENKFEEQNSATQNQLVKNTSEQEGEKINKGVEAEQNSSGGKDKK